MAKRSLDTLKSYFRSGRYPSQSNYEDLIDTLSGGTEYTAGDNVTIDNNVISATDTTYTASDFDIKDLNDSTDLKSTWNNKQDKLTAGTNITIENNVISSTGGNGLKQVDLTTYADGVEGEIVQHIGNTTDEYTHGYIYKLSPGKIVRYEDVTIPSGSTKLVYTNKFDSSRKIVYSVEEVTVPKVTTWYAQGGYVYLLNDDLRSRLFNLYQPYGGGSIDNEPSVISSTSNGLVYNYIDSLHSLAFGEFRTEGNISAYHGLYNYIKSVNLVNGFRTEGTTKSILGRVIDIVTLISIPVKYLNYDNMVKNHYILLKDLDDVNWEVESWASQLYPPDGDYVDYKYDNSRDFTFSDVGTVIITNNGVQYIIRKTIGAGQSSSVFYRTISSDGSESKYIDTLHKNCVFDSKPISSSNYWDDLINVEILFDYNVSETSTTNSITIHRAIQEYDEYGFPIDSMGLVWNRIDVQPANQLTAGDGITIDSNNVISANLWTSVTD